MFIILDIESKNQISLENFVFFFFNDKLISRFSRVVTYKQRHKKSNKITVLKSPHVNKTAQESFEIKYYRKKIKCFVSKPRLFLILLKKIKSTFFSELSLKIKFVFNRKIEKKKVKHTFNTNLYYLDNCKIKFIEYLKNMELYGEVCLR